MLVGIPAGVAAGRTRWLHDLLQLPVDFFRSIPSSALFFLFILTFGVGEVSKVMVVVYGCSLILFINAAYGAAPTPDKNFRLDLMRAFGASAAQRFWLVTIPEALPAIAAGVRTCLSLAFVLVIVTEMFLGAQQGLGKQLYDFYLGYRIPEMWVCLAVLGVTGSAANVAGIAIERRVTHWRARHVEEFADGI
jgi:NitT/TauT family transport system permease protein